MGRPTYSYIVPHAGTGGFAPAIDPKEVQSASKGASIVGNGHTHAGDTRVMKIDGKSYSTANQFSDQDIRVYNNTATKDSYGGTGKKVDNGYGKPATGYVATPDGGLREYEPGVSNNSNSGKKDAVDMPIKNYDIPVAKDLTSDPASGTLRLNNIPPTNMPNVLPKDFDPNQPKRY